MRVMVFFDLPVETALQRKAYRQFRKYLVKEGYLMIQESVYAKLAINEGAAMAAIADLKRHRPSQGLVQALRVTEKQFSTMTYITGSRGDYAEVDSMDELLVL